MAMMILDQHKLSRVNIAMMVLDRHNQTTQCQHGDDGLIKSGPNRKLLQILSGKSFTISEKGKLDRQP